MFQVVFLDETPHSIQKLSFLEKTDNFSSKKSSKVLKITKFGNFFYHNGSQRVFLPKSYQNGQFLGFFGKTDGFQWRSKGNFSKSLNKADFR